MMRRLGVLTLLIAISLVSSARADEGIYAFDSLTSSVNARALGMGNAFSSIGSDASAPFWNPAGISRVRWISISSTYSDLFGGFREGLVKHSFLAYSQRVEELGGTIGVCWLRVGVEDIPITGEEFIDVNGNGRLGDFQDKNGNGIKDPGEPYIDRPVISGSFDSYDDAVFISYALPLTGSLGAGISLKLLRQRVFENTGSGWGIDVGFRYTPWRSEGRVRGEASVAFVLRDLGTHIRWDTPSRASFSRPLSLTLGISTKLGIGYVSLLAAADYRSDEREIWTGAELTILRALSLRAGLYRGRPTFGAGFRIPIYRSTLSLDYAFTTHEDLGRTQIVAADFELWAR